MSRSVRSEIGMTDVFVSGVFDDLKSRDVRFLEKASRFGSLTVHLWSDESLRRAGVPAPRFPQNERVYILEAIRYVSRVNLLDGRFDPDGMPPFNGDRPFVWVVTETEDTPVKRLACSSAGIEYRLIPDSRLDGFPPPANSVVDPVQKKVIVTGCYDWLHSGHIRFFEQASAYGDLYVSLGNDANIHGLKGDGHPLQTQQERAYMVGAIRFVTQAFVAAGFGWLDAEAEIDRLKPDIYLVNEDGDRAEKRAFCAAHGLEYVVLQRLPKDGLPSRQSTELRGF
jgi:cytidyltransferase-like protein